MPPEPDPQGPGWALGLHRQSWQETPCPEPWCPWPTCPRAGHQSSDPHQDTASVPMSLTAAASPHWGAFPAQVTMVHHPTGASEPTLHQPPSRAPQDWGQHLLGAAPCPRTIRPGPLDTGVPRPRCRPLHRALLTQVPTRSSTNLAMGWCFPASPKVPTLVGTRAVKGKANRDKE